MFIVKKTGYLMRLDGTKRTNALNAARKLSAIACVTIAGKIRLSAWVLRISIFNSHAGVRWRVKA